MSVVCAGVSSCLSPVPCTNGVTTASPHWASCGMSSSGNPRRLAMTRWGSGRANRLMNSTLPSPTHSSTRSFACFVIMLR